MNEGLNCTIKLIFRLYVLAGCGRTVNGLLQLDFPFATTTTKLFSPSKLGQYRVETQHKPQIKVQTCGSRHDTSSRGCQPGPCLFNTISGILYDTSLRGLRHNIFFVFCLYQNGQGQHWFIKPITTPLLYQGLGPAMMKQYRRSLTPFCIHD